MIHRSTQHTALALLALLVGCESSDLTDAPPLESVEAAAAKSSSSPPSSSMPFAPAPPPPLRVVNVSTQSQLLKAVGAALPGDEIRLAPGTYYGGVQMAIGKGGLPGKPLVIRCPRGVVIDRGGYTAGYGLRIRGPHVQVRGGCTVRNAQFGVSVERGSGGPEPTDAVFDSLDVRDVGQSGYVLWDAHRAVIQRGKVSNTGLATPYGEGIYVGHSRDAAQMSHGVKVLGTTFGPNIRAEHIDIKGLASGRSTGTLVQGNHFDATGTRYVWQPLVQAIAMDQGGQDSRWIENVVTGVNSAGLSGFATVTSIRPVLYRNQVDPSRNSISGTHSRGFRVINPTTEAKVYCDNVGTKNVTCVP
jgi:hypothetical protein